MRLKRRAISLEYRATASQAVAQHFIQGPLFKENMHFACYLATSDELDLQPLIQAIWQAGKYCYLPLISPALTLTFGLYEANTSLKPNIYGIPEPQDSDLIEPNQLEIVLMPLLAFDLKGHRLGTGGGYYDRTFGFLNAVKAAKPVLVGAGFELQRLEEVPSEGFDVGLDGVVTEQGCFDITG
jgi:5-formyltetrahydrofolate cyclo-ligase